MGGVSAVVVVVLFEVGVGLGGCGIERCEWGGGRLSFEEGCSSQVGLFNDLVVLVAVAVVVAAVVTGGVEERGDLGGSLFSTRGVGCFWIHLF